MCCFDSIIFSYSKNASTIHMATKPMTEQYIPGSMMKALIEQATDLTVEITEGVGGGTSNIQPAMEKGDFDFYPEYTGTGWNIILKEKSIYDESQFSELQSGYNKLYMSWTGMLGFNNTFGIAVRRDIAQQTCWFSERNMTFVKSAEPKF